MVVVFRRSLSFPNKPGPAADRQPKPRISRHLRSISLPCRSHHLISSLKDEMVNLKAWSSTDHRTAAWLCRGLASLKLVHDYLNDILQLPQSRESMRRLSASWVENVLEGFLRFIDAYGMFQSLILGFLEDHVAAHVGIRRKEETKVELYRKARKRMAKETGQLASVVRPGVTVQAVVSEEEEELTRAVKDVMEVTEMVSVVLFEGIGVSLGWRRRRNWMGKGKKVKVENGILDFMGEGELMMKDSEVWIRRIQSESQNLFRTLMNSRVSILNALSY